MIALRKLPGHAATRVSWRQQTNSSCFSYRCASNPRLWSNMTISPCSIIDTHQARRQPHRLEYLNDNLRSFSIYTKNEENLHNQPNDNADDDAESRFSNGKTRLLECAVRGDAPEAQRILEDLESILHSNSIDQTSHWQDKLVECRLAVLDAWMVHQDALVQEWEALHNHHQDDKDDNVPCKLLTLEHQIFHAANKAHQALEQSMPFLMRPALAFGSQQQQQQQQQPQASPKRQSLTVDEDMELLQDTSSFGSPLPVGSPLLSTKNKLSPPTVIRHRCNAVLAAWAEASRVAGNHRKTKNNDSISKGIPQRATYLVQRMEAIGTTTVPMTTTDSYNRVLAAWAWSREHLRATMAEQIFRRMWKIKHANPNGESYRWIIQAWCWSGQKKAAFNATGHLMKLLRRIENGRESIQPLPETYHMAMKAWTMAGDRNAPMKASSVLRIMEYAFEMGFCSVPVDETVYRYYLMALSRWSVVPEQGPLADQVINKLKERQIVPDKELYGAAIRTHKNSAANPLFVIGRETSVTRAVELLEEVSLAHHRSALVSVKPDTQNYNDVLEALSASSRAVSKVIAETLIKVMEGSPEGEDIRPNAESYRWLLAVHARSKAHDKMESARDALERMKTSIAPTFSNDEPAHGEAILGVYNAFLEVCASVTDNPDNSTELLQGSLAAVDELKTLYSLKPDPRTYANLFEVCKWHLALGAERDQIVESIFESCRNEGLVDSRVLHALKAVASEEHYMKLVVSHSIVEGGIRMVPEAWTKNAVGAQRVVSADGRKSVPLSVDGRYTVTKAMKEYRMRKLRSHVNRNVLHGGRMKLSKKEMGEYIHITLDEP